MKKIHFKINHKFYKKNFKRANNLNSKQKIY